MNKQDLFLWACSVLRDNIDSGTYGNVTFSMQNGTIGSAKVEKNEKPPLDVPKRNP